MTKSTAVHANEEGMALNAVPWLETHHRMKVVERHQMIRDLHIAPGSFVVDAGCGPGVWSALLLAATGRTGRLLGIDLSPEAVIKANQRRHEIMSQCAGDLHYVCGPLEQLPVPPRSVDVVFSANVSQYLADPVTVFRGIGASLRRGGRLAIKDIDFGTLRFHGVDADRHARVLDARRRWEPERPGAGREFEDSWVGSKLAAYLRAAGYRHVVERTYPIVRHGAASDDLRVYIEGIAEWLIGEDSPYLADDDRASWIDAFFGDDPVTARTDFCYEEAEYVAVGVWPSASTEEAIWATPGRGPVDDV